MIIILLQSLKEVQYCGPVSALGAFSRAPKPAISTILLLRLRPASVGLFFLRYPSNQGHAKRSYEVVSSTPLRFIKA